jgi:hypothetical protein
VASIFLSYRRSDSSGWAGRLKDSLERLLPSAPTFQDVDNIPPGMNFEDVIKKELEGCELFIAVIGPQWLEVRDATGQRRLDSEEDHTRLEIEAGLKRDIRVIPVLVGGARMPTARELPESLRSLAKRQNFELPDRGWDIACQSLARAIGEAIQPFHPPSTPVVNSRRSVLVPLAVAAILFGLVMIAVIAIRQNQSSAAEPVHASQLSLPTPSPGPIPTVAAAPASPVVDNPPAAATAVPETFATATPAPSPIFDPRREAELLGVQYATAILKHDLPTLVERASMPFFMDNRVLLSPDDVRRGYESLFKQPSRDEDVTILRVETRTIGEWKARGLDPTHDRLLKSITLSDDDFLVGVTVPNNGLGIYMRRTGGALSVAGWWD